MAAAAAMVSIVGYQDDLFFRCSVRSFLRYEPVLLEALAPDGHELQPSKSKVWIPSLDDVEAADDHGDVQALWERRARSGTVALGSS
ncbi:MAG: hypothetical protein ACKPKO_56880, partial [Candidatus Fonsibacter sp.]